ncbi:MAG: hypothetical protein JO256_01690, partial [Alphaproteobacteria bacterium]|nr:hypothetical protein [Alphaproteobacteria bacterium]
MKRLAVLSAALLAATMPLGAQPQNPAAPAMDQSENIIGPDYTPAPDLVIPHGSITTFTMESTDSKIYPGIARIDNETMARRDQWGNR